jgi:hypothetical protein
LHLRRIEKAGILVAAIAGAALPPGTISGDVRSVLVTFLGLFSASILPTISLLINSMTASGRSVQSIDKLESEIQAAMDALFFLFACVVLTVAGLACLAIPPSFFGSLPYPDADFIPRAGQAVVAVGITMLALRAGQLPGILRRSLAVRHEIARTEARRKLGENAPDSDAIKRAYPTHADFGKVVPLSEVPGRESR